MKGDEVTADNETRLPGQGVRSIWAAGAARWDSMGPLPRRTILTIAALIGAGTAFSSGSHFATTSLPHPGHTPTNCPYCSPQGVDRTPKLTGPTLTWTYKGHTFNLQYSNSNRSDLRAAINKESPRLFLTGHSKNTGPLWDYSSKMYEAAAGADLTLPQWEKENIEDIPAPHTVAVMGDDPTQWVGKARTFLAGAWAQLDQVVTLRNSDGYSTSQIEDFMLASSGKLTDIKHLVDTIVTMSTYLAVASNNYTHTTRTLQSVNLPEDALKVIAVQSQLLQQGTGRDTVGAATSATTQEAVIAPSPTTPPTSTPSPR